VQTLARDAERRRRLRLIAAVIALLVYEHSLVKADDFSRVNAAFFTMNGWVSVLFLIFWAADIFLLKPGI
jgi:4-hydroxybenzoate polyprenyltransferase